MSLLADKVAVVTGAGRGIGRAVAIAYARMGADVVCVSRTEENSAKVAAEVEELGRKAWAKAAARERQRRRELQARYAHTSSSAWQVG